MAGNEMAEAIARGERTPPSGVARRRVQQPGGTPAKTQARGGRLTGAGRRAAKKAAALAAAAAAAGGGAAEKSQKELQTSSAVDRPMAASPGSPPRKAKVPSSPMPPSADSIVATPATDQSPDKAIARGPDNAVTVRLLKTKMCYFFERGKCASVNCRYAHSKAELRNQPNLQKTKLCKSFAQEGKCTEGARCPFAHGEVELKHTEGIYKTQMCHFFERGKCLKGDRCNHAHGLEDLRIPPPEPESPQSLRRAQQTTPLQQRSGFAASPQANADGVPPKGALQLSEMLSNPTAATQVPINPLALQQVTAQATVQAAAAAGAVAALTAGLLPEYLVMGAPPVWMPSWGMTAGLPSVPLNPAVTNLNAVLAGLDGSTSQGTTAQAAAGLGSADWCGSPLDLHPVDGEQAQAHLNLSERLEQLDSVLKGFSMDVSNLQRGNTAVPTKPVPVATTIQKQMYRI